MLQCLHVSQKARFPASGFFIGAPGKARGAKAPFGCIWCVINHLEVDILYRPDRGIGANIRDFSNRGTTLICKYILLLIKDLY